MHPNGIAKQSLNAIFEINNSINTEDQLISLLKEINCLMHELKLKAYSKQIFSDINLCFSQIF